MIADHSGFLFSEPTTWCFPGMTRSVRYSLPLISVTIRSLIFFTWLILLLFATGRVGPQPERGRSALRGSAFCNDHNFRRHSVLGVERLPLQSISSFPHRTFVADHHCSQHPVPVQTLRTSGRYIVQTFRQVRQWSCIVRHVQSSLGVLRNRTCKPGHLSFAQPAGTTHIRFSIRILCERFNPDVPEGCDSLFHVRLMSYQNRSPLIPLAYIEHSSVFQPIVRSSIQKLFSNICLKFSK